MGMFFFQTPDLEDVALEAPAAIPRIPVATLQERDLQGHEEESKTW